MMTRKKHPPIKAGDVFGQWTVVGPSESKQFGKAFRYYFPCQCSCGLTKPVLRAALVTGQSTKCLDCARRLYPKGEKSKAFVHGCATSSGKTPEYSIWCAMKARCSDPSGPYYHRYGGRGIRVCERWGDFSMFLADMGKKPTPKHQLDRIDNDGNYTPENCRWASPKENTRNKPDLRFLTLNGETHCLAEWAEIKKMHKNTLTKRLKMGWDTERAINTPVDKRYARLRKTKEGSI